MRSTLGRFARLTAGYSLVTLLGPVFTIILTPLYTRALAPADYAVVDVALTLANFCAMVAVLGMDQALGAYFFDEAASPAYQRRLVTTAALSALGLSTAFGLGLVAAARPLAVALFKDAGRIYLMYFLAAHVLASPLVAVMIAALKLRMAVRRVNALALTSLLATVGINVVLVIGLGLKATGIIAATAAASLLVAALAVALTRGPFWGRFDPRLMRSLARAGVTLAIGTLSLGLLMNADRLLLTQFVPLEELGLYSIANKLSTMTYVLLSAAWNAWFPMALEMAGRPEAPRQYVQMFDYFAAAALAVALGVGLFAPEILLVFTRAAYVPAAPYTLALAGFHAPITFIGLAAFIQLYATKQVHWIGIGYAIAAAINIGLNLLLDAALGAWGAVLATLLAGAVWLAIVHAAGQRSLPLHYHWGRVGAAVAAYAALVAAFLLVPALSQPAIKAAGLALFGAFLVGAGLVPLAHLGQAWHEVHAWLARQRQA